jgi:RNA-binding protein YlmH
MLGFFPVDESVYENFPIARLRIEHNSKFNKAPRHQDYLGAMLGLGFSRGRIGDIFKAEEYADVFVSRDIAGYICEQMDKAGRVPVTVRVLSENEETSLKLQETEEIINAASLRLDVILAAMFRLSRGQASALVGAEKVFVNWSPCTEAGKQLKPGDTVTLRGYGRGKIGDILGTTKKGRLRLIVFRT